MLNIIAQYNLFIFESLYLLKIIMYEVIKNTFS